MHIITWQHRLLICLCTYHCTGWLLLCNYFLTCALASQEKQQRRERESCIKCLQPHNIFIIRVLTPKPRETHKGIIFKCVLCHIFISVVPQAFHAQTKYAFSPWCLEEHVYISRTTQSLHRAWRIRKDNTHPSHSLSLLQPAKDTQVSCFMWQSYG